MKVTIIIIGLNEEDHIGAALASAYESIPAGLKAEVIYVDSGSKDRSLEIAQDVKGTKVFVLHDPMPTAAKGRNLGLRHATGEFIQFLDGDSILQSGWIAAAISALEKQQDVAAVFGKCIEAFPRQSLYMRACQYDWHVSPGDHRLCGGNALWRRQALEETGHYDPDLPVGEEPELCYRARALNWRILCLDLPMVKHDLAMTTFKSYWGRAVRSGQGYAFLGLKFHRANEKLWFREMLRNFAEPSLWLIFLAAWLLSGYPVILVMLVGLILLRFLSVAIRSQPRTASFFDAIVYAAHTQFSKIPLATGQLIGLWKYFFHKPGN